MSTAPSSQEEQAWQTGYQAGFQAGVDHKRTILSLGAEETLPSDFADYIDENEREIIGGIVQSPDFKHFFRQNMLRQALLRHRQARLMMKNIPAMHLLHNVGNAISDLVLFYDNAKTKEGTVVEPMEDGGYDNVHDY